MKRMGLFFAGTLLLVGYGFFSWGQAKTIWVPKMGVMAENEAKTEASEADQEILDMADEDPILLESFQDLARAKFELHRPYIIARIEAGGVHHYYDAHALNKYLFGFLTGVFADLQTYHDIQRAAIGRLDYFILNNPEEQAFTYLCSFQDIVEHIEHWRNYFYQNQEIVLAPEEKLEAAQDIITAQQRGSYYLAFEYLKEVADQQENAQAAGTARVLLGDLYYHGLSATKRWIIPKDYTQAAHYWQGVANDQFADRRDSATAWLHLGKMYEEGGDNFPRRYAKAYECYRNVLEYPDLHDQAAEGIARIEAEHRMDALKEIALEKLHVKADRTNAALYKNYRLNILCDMERALRPESSAQEGKCSVQ
jgi:hypothetical protein